jgi:hypothetical protein
MAAVRAMVAGQKHMSPHSFAGAEDPQVCVQAGCARAKSAFWLSLHIYSLVHRHLPCKGWDVVGVSHPFLFVSGQPSRLFVRLPFPDNASSSCTYCMHFFLLLFLLGCRQFCPVCLCFLCFASLQLTVLPLLVGAQLWSLVVSLVLFVLLHALLPFAMCVPLC